MVDNDNFVSRHSSRQNASTYSINCTRTCHRYLKSLVQMVAKEEAMIPDYRSCAEVRRVSKYHFTRKLVKDRGKSARNSSLNRCATSVTSAGSTANWDISLPGTPPTLVCCRTGFVTTEPALIIAPSPTGIFPITIDPAARNTPLPTLEDYQVKWNKKVLKSLH